MYFFRLRSKKTSWIQEVFFGVAKPLFFHTATEISQNSKSILPPEADS